VRENKENGENYKIRAAYIAAFSLYTRIKTNNIGRMRNLDMKHK
jgi:hypothetical protein